MSTYLRFSLRHKHQKDLAQLNTVIDGTLRQNQSEVGKSTQLPKNDAPKFNVLCIINVWQKILSRCGLKKNRWNSNLRQQLAGVMHYLCTRGRISWVAQTKDQRNKNAHMFEGMLLYGALLVALCLWQNENVCDVAILLAACLEACIVFLAVEKLRMLGFFPYWCKMFIVTLLRHCFCLYVPSCGTHLIAIISISFWMEFTVLKDAMLVQILYILRRQLK